MTPRRAGLVVAVLVGAIAVGAGIFLFRAESPTSVVASPLFVDETAASGVSQRFDGPDLYQVGGGLAVFDCNGDHLPDLYLAGGERPAELYRNRSAVGGPLHFERVPSAATDLTAVNGAYPLDFDGDGIADLAILRVGQNVLLRGHGDCTFEPVNGSLGLMGTDGFTTAFSATWEGDAKLPTLAIGRYLKLDDRGDATFTCDGNTLLRPNADGSAYGTPIPLAPGYCALSMLFGSWDGSGRRDLRVSNDRQYYSDGSEQLWRMAPDQAPTLYTAADGWPSLQIWGMGIASQDLTGDGLPEVYLTSQGDNKLQTLAAGAGRPAFRDIALQRGVTSTRPFAGDTSLPSTAWHPEFVDVNNDGFIDLFVSKGNVGAQADYARRDPSDLFLGQADGTFVEAADGAGIVRFDRGRGAALADLNLDGLPDLVEVNYRADTVVWRNVGRGTAAVPAPMGHWLMLEIRQPGPNRDAIGAWVDVRIGDATVRHELTVGGGHVGGELGWLHIGLGPALSAEVRVVWPDGEEGPWLKVDADRFAIVERGATAVQPWTPGGAG
ncbi:MAG: CRTAC1 family protein [Chloroflexota bacterium]|nr:CRTAC1 family protein [Chloroflexota bacterium]